MTPDYEYFQSAKEGTFSDCFKGVANEAPSADSCNGIIYNVFYHKEKGTNKSSKVLIPVDNQDENNSLSDGANENDASNELCSRASLSVNNLEKNGDENEEDTVLYEDERALVLLENEGSLDGLVNGNNGNKEIESLPLVGKALSPISKLVKSSYIHDEEKESSFAQEYQFFSDHDNKSASSRSTSENETVLASENADNGRRSSLKLNLQYLCQRLDFKVLDRPSSPYHGDGTSTSSTDHGSSSRTPEFSTSSSPPCSYYSMPHMESETSNLPGQDYRAAREFDPSYKFPSCSDRMKGNENPLSARVKKLDIKKQLYLAHILDKLEIAQVTGSVDLSFCQHSPH